MGHRRVHLSGTALALTQASMNSPLAVDRPSAEQESGSRSLIKDLASWGGASAVAQALTLAADVAISRMLGPGLRGVWEFMLVVLQYGDYSNLGVRSALGRELPVAIGAGERARAATLERDSFAFNITAAGATTALVLLWAAWTFTTDPILAGALAGAAVILFLQQWYGFFVITFRSYRRFDLSSRVHMLRGLLVLTLHAGGVWLFGFGGLIAGAVASHLILVATARSLWPTHHPWAVSPASAKRLVTVGLPFLSIGLLDLAFTSADRLLIAGALSFEQLGFYSIATMTFAMLSFIPNVASTVLYPRVCEAYGRSSSESDVKGLLHAPIILLAASMTIVGANLAVVLPWVVEIVLPRFSPGIAAAQITTIGAVFAAMAVASSTGLIAIDRLARYQGALLFCAVVGGTLVLVSPRFGGLEAVATAMTIGHVTRFLVFTACLTPNQPARWRWAGRLILKVSVPIAWGLVAFALASQLGPIESAGIQTMVIRVLALNALMLPVVLAMLRDLGLPSVPGWIPRLVGGLDE